MTMPGNPLIRITEDEANSEHADSLLRRQMSLRGEQGITAVAKRHWYFRNWFILMLVAGTFSFLAWAIVEPFFADMLYLQGQITEMDLGEPMPSVFTSGGQSVKVRIGGQGWVKIQNEKIWLTDLTRPWPRRKEPFNPDDLKLGQQVGIYFETLHHTSDTVALAEFVVNDPKPQSAGEASLTVYQLEARHSAAAMLLFPLVAGLIGMGVGATEGVVCRMPRRALLSGVVGLLIGLLGGFVSNIVANLLYAPLSLLAAQSMKPGGGLTGFAFFVQLTARGLAWMLAGCAMGLGQGIALRSKRLLLYGFLGGIVGGLLGGLLFDPIDLVLLGHYKPSAFIARMIGITVIGLCVGAMIGIVELLARDAWLRMVEGPLAGKEFLLFKDTMRVGASSHSDIYLFNDPQVAQQHAILRSLDDQCYIDAAGQGILLLVNGRPTSHSRLRHGDQITIGKTSFLFQSRKG